MAASMSEAGTVAGRPCASYTDPRLAAVYDPLNPPDAADAFYLDLAGDRPLTILDVGCGTGRLATALAERGQRVTGADPAGAMLDVARRRPGGDRVRWVEGTAGTLALGPAFDLIIMTGHVFQVFLEDNAVLAALSNLREHLAPGGKLAFEMRNAAVRDWETWTPDETREVVQVPGIGPVEVFHDIAAVDGRLVTFETHFVFGPGDTGFTESTLRFMDHDEVERFVEAAELRAQAWYGDWDRSAIADDSPEIIVIAGRG